MTRTTRSSATLPPDDFSVILELVGGPDEHTEEELELAWGAYGEDLMLRCPGTRPWGWWRFEVGEVPSQDDDEPIRLAELGLLRDDEIAAIAERANEARMRVGTAAEHYGPDCRPDRDAVELHEAVKRAPGSD